MSKIRDPPSSSLMEPFTHPLDLLPNAFPPAVEYYRVKVPLQVHRLAHNGAHLDRVKSPVETERVVPCLGRGGEEFQDGGGVNAFREEGYRDERVTEVVEDMSDFVGDVEERREGEGGELMRSELARPAIKHLQHLVPPLSLGKLSVGKRGLT